MILQIRLQTPDSIPALRASRFALRASRFALRASRFALPASRFALRASRFAISPKRDSQIVSDSQIVIHCSFMEIFMKIKVLAEKGGQSFMASSFELHSDSEINRLRLNSIERVINSAIQLIEEHDDPLGQVVYNDLHELKTLMVRLWYSAQQAVFAAQNNML